jgi:hypothetical protein
MIGKVLIKEQRPKITREKCEDIYYNVNKVSVTWGN